MCRPPFVFVVFFFQLQLANESLHLPFLPTAAVDVDDGADKKAREKRVHETYLFDVSSITLEKRGHSQRGKVRRDEESCFSTILRAPLIV